MAQRELQGDWLDLFNTPSLDFLLAEDADIRILKNPPVDWPLRLFTLKKPVIIELSLTSGDLDQAALCNDYTLQSQLFQTAIPACFAVKADGVLIFNWGTDLLSPPAYDSCYYYTISNAPIRDVLQGAAIGLNALDYPMPPLHFVTIGQFSGKKYFLFAP